MLDSVKVQAAVNALNESRVVPAVMFVRRGFVRWGVFLKKGYSHKKILVYMT